MNMEHWAQGVRAAGAPRMVAMDYGTDCTGGPWAGLCNQMRYGSTDPPAYDLHHISIPVALLSGMRFLCVPRVGYACMRAASRSACGPCHSHHGSCHHKSHQAQLVPQRQGMWLPDKNVDSWLLRSAITGSMWRRGLGMQGVQGVHACASGSVWLRRCVRAGDNDVLAPPEDVALLQAALPQKHVVFAKEYPGYSHLDFTWGTGAHRDVYQDVLAVLANISAPSQHTADPHVLQ
jgi:hypothetical protein